MTAQNALRRPVLRYHGGKWKLAPWVLTFLPPHRLYVEPFGGGASVLMRKRRAHAEVYNDLDGEVVNVFRVLQDPAKADRLRGLLELTPFSRSEFMLAHERAGLDDVELARRAIVRSFFGYGTSSLHARAARGMRARASTSAIRVGTGFRADAHGNGSTPATDWRNYPENVSAFVDRLRGVVVEQRPALEVIAQHDRPGAVIYCDPPYVASTRADARPDYAFEMSDEEHRELAGVLRGAAAAVVLSGYPSPLYDEELYPDWLRFERKHRAHDAAERTEVIWINDACAEALGHGGLFAVGDGS